MDQQHLLAPADQHDDGRRDGRVDLVAAAGATLHDRARLGRRRAACRTETAVLVPISQLARLARLGIPLGGEDRPARAEPHEAIRRLGLGRVDRSDTPRRPVVERRLDPMVDHQRGDRPLGNPPARRVVAQQQLVVVEYKPISSHRHSSFLYYIWRELTKLLGEARGLKGFFFPAFPTNRKHALYA